MKNTSQNTWNFFRLVLFICVSFYIYLYIYIYNKWQYEEPSASLKILKKLSKNLKFMKNKMNTWKINHISI